MKYLVVLCSVACLWACVISKSTYQPTSDVNIMVTLSGNADNNINSATALHDLHSLIAQTSPQRLHLSVGTQSGSIELTLHSSPLILPRKLKVIYFENDSTLPKNAFIDSKTTACHLYSGDGRIQAISTHVSICGDELDGELHVNNVTLRLQSQQEGSGALRFTLQQKKPSTPGKCGNHHGQSEGDSVQNRMQRDISVKDVKTVRPPSNSNSSTRYIELYIVVDNALYLRSGSDQAKTIQRVVKVINYASLLYTQLNIYLAIVGIEVWTDADKFSVTGKVDDVLQEFAAYRRKDINSHTPNDNAQMFVAEAFDEGTVGQGSMSVCSHVGSSAVTADHHEDDWIQAATTMAHELGHNLGLKHDDEFDDPDRCMCTRTDGVNDNKCIMYSISDSTQPIEWSVCSKEVINFRFSVNHTDHCLKNLPPADELQSSCGNFFVEDGEECDCGPASGCDTSCCDPATCKLTAGSECASGLCCDKEICKLKPLATECRPTVDKDCDLAEYCSGESEWCPLDTYKYNGIEANTEHCYKGKLRTRDAQCSYVWGPDVNSSTDECYTSYNVKGKYYGNCGYNVTELAAATKPDVNYTKCALEDAMCGLLHCHTDALAGVVGIKTYANYYGFYHPDVTGGRCSFVGFDVGLEDIDPGLVPNGAKCGENRWCQSQKCVAIQPVPISCDCNDHGTCNQHGRCHCDVGYDPLSQCLQSGEGGSIDSNPASRATATTTVTPPAPTKQWVVRNFTTASGTSSSGNIVTTTISGASDSTLVVSLVVIVVLVAVIVMVIKRRQILEFIQKKKNARPGASGGNIETNAYDSNNKLNASKVSAASSISSQNRKRDYGPISTPTLESTTNSNIILQDLPNQNRSATLDNPIYFDRDGIPANHNIITPPLKVADLCHSTNTTLCRSDEELCALHDYNKLGAKNTVDDPELYEEPELQGSPQSSRHSAAYSDIDSIISDDATENHHATSNFEPTQDGEKEQLLRDCDEGTYEVPDVTTQGYKSALIDESTTSGDA